MKVLILGSGNVQIPPKRGGAVEKIVYDLASAICEEHDVPILDFTFGSEAERIKDQDFEILRHPLYKTGSLRRQIAFGFTATNYLNDFDVVHGHTPFSCALLTLKSKFKFSSRLERPKFLYTCHNPAWALENPSLLERLVNKLELFVMRKVDFVTTVSDFMRERLVNELKGKEIVRIYNAVDIEEASTAERRESPLVLFMGQHTKAKGFRTFVKACETLEETYGSINAISIGPWRRFGENREKPYECGPVNPKGQVSEEEKLKLLSEADVFLAPTRRESLGIAVIEALAAGCSIVASNIPPLRESVIPDKTGILIRDPKDHESFARAASKIIDEDWRSEHCEDIISSVEKFERGKIEEECRNLYALLQ